MQCLNCYTSEMMEPIDHHPSYLVCTNFDAIELTYKAQDYQEKLHEVPYRLASNGTIKPQIIASFGGYGSGKSKSSLEEFFIRCMENEKGTGLVTAPTLQLLK